MDRAFAWDAQGLVPFTVDYTFTKTDLGWIESMTKGEYASASVAAAKQCTDGKPTFFAIWVVANSGRVRRSTTELASLADKLNKDSPGKPTTLYARYRLDSLRLAQIPIQDARSDNPTYRQVVEAVKADWNLAKAEAPKNLPLAVALACDTDANPLEVRAMVTVAIAATPSKDKLLLWQCRALLNGQILYNLNPKTSSFERDRQGQVKVRFDERGPDIKGAREALTSYRNQFPTDAKCHYYEARILAVEAAYFSNGPAEKDAKMRQAVTEAQAFLKAENQPQALVDSANKFLRKPHPGSFIARPKE